MPKAMRGNVFSLFGDRDEEIPETPLESVSSAVTQPVSSTGSSAVDLTGKPKIIMIIGPGRSGKSTVARWTVERALDRDDGSDLVLATVDTQRATLKRFFPTAMTPKSAETALPWLEKLLARLIETRKTAVIDFGADASPLPIIAQIPDLCRIASDAGVEIVSFNMLTPRSADLTLLASMEGAEFKPMATGLVLNLGTAMSQDPYGEFSQLQKHSAYRAAIERGAVEIWLPRLWAAKAVEDRGLGFRQSMNHAAGETSQLNDFDRSRVHDWLDKMEKSFAATNSWLP